MVSNAGLAYCEYYLLKTKARNGYSFTLNAIPLTIDVTSHLDEHAIIFENTAARFGLQPAA